MTIFDERPAQAGPSRRYWLLALPILIAAVWFIQDRSHKASQMTQMIHEIRGDAAAADDKPNRPMAAALLVRNVLLRYPRSPLAKSQSDLLVKMVNSPVNDLSQSEAISVLSMALRTGALSPMQRQQAQDATLRVMRGSPGPMVRCASARILGHLGDPHNAAVLTALQQDSDPNVREAAGQALTRLPISSH